MGAAEIVRNAGDTGVRSGISKSGSCEKTRGELWMPVPPSAIHSRSNSDSQRTVDRSFEGFQQAIENFGEILIVLAHRIDFPNGVQDGGVVLAAKMRADGGE